MNVGDIVVFIGENPTKQGIINKLSIKGTSKIISSYWFTEGNDFPPGVFESSLRQATQREIEAYNNGIRNINAIPKVHIDDIIGTNSLIFINSIEQQAFVSKCFTNDNLIKNERIEKDFPTAIYLSNINGYSWDVKETVDAKRYNYVFNASTVIYNFEDIDFEPKFVLPEKWYVKVQYLTPFQIEAINRYIQPIWNSKWTFTKEDMEKPYYIQNKEYSKGVIRPYCLRTILNGYTEITFEQFEKYVLNKKEEIKVEPTKPDIKILGEQVEFIKKSIQFGDVTLTLKDLEAIKRVYNICKEQDISLEFTQGYTIYIDNDNSEGQKEVQINQIDTIIKTLNG